MLLKFILPLVILISYACQAQETGIDFLKKVNSLYYSIESTNLQNFSAWISSDYFTENLKNELPGEVYPIEIIWTSPNRLFFIKRPLPVISDTTKSNLAQNLQLELQQELKGVLMDWQRFYGGSIVAGLPPQYQQTDRLDTILIEYETIEQGNKIYACMYFGKNGLLLKLQLWYVDLAQMIVIYPGFNYVDNKFLCSGWQVQIFEQGEVKSGFSVQLISHKIDTYWLPKKLNMQLQTREKRELIYQREYNFYNVMTNRSIKVIE